MKKKNEMTLVYKLADVIKGFTFGQELNAARGGKKKVWENVEHV